MEIAIVTGASSGLGREYAKLLDQEGLDEIWLVARRRPQSKLTEERRRGQPGLDRSWMRALVDCKTQRQVTVQH